MDESGIDYYQFLPKYSLPNSWFLLYARKYCLQTNKKRKNVKNRKKKREKKTNSIEQYKAIVVLENGKC